jgi:hypothetical protein
VIEYVCGDCGNRLPESAVVTIVPGSIRAVSLYMRPVCCRGEMVREEIPDDTDGAQA